MKEWGVPEPIKFKPKKLIMNVYPEEYKKYVVLHNPNSNRMTLGSYLLISIIGAIAFYYTSRFIIRQIKLYMKDRKYEEYHKIDNSKTENLTKAV